MARFIVCGARNGSKEGMLCLFDNEKERTFFPPYPQFLGNAIAKALVGFGYYESKNLVSYDVSLIEPATKKRFGIVSAADTFHREWLSASIIGAM